jgi:hypothetical protein
MKKFICVASVGLAALATAYIPAGVTAAAPAVAEPAAPTTFAKATTGARMSPAASVAA